MLSGWDSSWSYLIRMTYDQMQDVIRMTYNVSLCHPDEITKIWYLSHPDDLAIPSISSGWLIVDALCHPDDLPGVGISSGWVTANSWCHPDDTLFHFMSSGWLNWGWFLIRMSYGNVIMSSGWDTFPFLSHPDEIANFDFPQHAVALQRFRRGPMSQELERQTCCMRSQPHERLWPPLLKLNLEMVGKLVSAAVEVAKSSIPVFNSNSNSRDFKFQFHFQFH